MEEGFSTLFQYGFRDANFVRVDARKYVPDRWSAQL